MAHDYPRVGAEPRPHPKWAAIAEGKPGPKCVVCGKRALFGVFIEESPLRSEDTGPFRACDEHKRDAAALLEATWPTPA